MRITRSSLVVAIVAGCSFSMSGQLNAKESIDLTTDLSLYSHNWKKEDGHYSSNLAGRLDLSASLDTADIGLWKNGRFSTHLVSRFGDANGYDFPILSSPNAAFYGGTDETFLSAFYYQHSGDDWYMKVGKIDAIELLKEGTFYGGAARSGFNNISFVAPPSGVTPPAFLGLVSGFSLYDLDWSFMLYDPRDRYSGRGHLKGAFEDGVNLSLGTTKRMRVFSRETSIGLSGTLSTESGSDLASLEPDLTFSETAQQKYNIRAQLTHDLAGLPTGEGWGLYMRGSVADGNPNYFSGTFTAGLGGKATFLNRGQDDWGFGYYKNNLSNDFQNAFKHLQLGYEVNDEDGLEAFYAYNVNKWLSIKGDLQYVSPTLSHYKERFIGSVSFHLSNIW
ncbi:carbohydrate porin [Vibrio sp. HN007]|uniref:carbohydrate porin n=1 Tax=Vibrio iocasae TaxID=3098914 RepID=UPI0035D3E5E4